MYLTSVLIYDILYVKLALHITEVIDIRTKIPELRREFGMTQKELADKLSVSRQTVISLENGRYNPSIHLAYNIAKVFGRTIEEVFIFEEE